MPEKLHILMLNYEFPPLGGGASPCSFEIAKGYVKSGHDVDVVTMSFKGLPAFENVNGISVYRVPCLRSKKEICHPWEQLSYIFSAKKFLKNHLKSNSYDINHTHFIIPTGSISLWLKKRYNLPYILTSHGSDVLGYNKRFRYIYPLVERKWKEIIREAKIITAPSQFLIDKIKDISQEGKFMVIPNGIDPEKFKPMKKEKKILVVARLFPNKGVQDILDALTVLSFKDNGWKVDIIGDGPYRSKLEKKAQQNGLVDVVTFHGWVDNNSQAMKDFYGKASIFISASYFESFGLTLLEAISAGCYPIVSDIAAHKEVLKNNPNVFKKNDAISIKDKIIEAISNSFSTQSFPNEFSLEEVNRAYSEII